MIQAYSDPTHDPSEAEVYVLPEIEVFYVSVDDVEDSIVGCFYPGWYWWADSQSPATGPFLTKEEAFPSVRGWLIEAVDRTFRIRATASCGECGDVVYDEDGNVDGRVLAGMKCGWCAYGY